MHQGLGSWILVVLTVPITESSLGHRRRSSVEPLARYRSDTVDSERRSKGRDSHLRPASPGPEPPVLPYHFTAPQGAVAPPARGQHTLNPQPEEEGGGRGRALRRGTHNVWTQSPAPDKPAKPSAFCGEMMVKCSKLSLGKFVVFKALRKNDATKNSLAEQTSDNRTSLTEPEASRNGRRQLKALAGDL
ncbi:unnamed protein product [Pleuronectes platessa]|uniref:Uncharacterized protein n=1 Tax=Pleuronectes platessa TaxID=8262 RepID=A0A9N7VUF1_PLEPL|nr:unnamed protein product [Pleuronectes platessa]